ncbi:hypothetical protein [Bradyrhizobium sp. CCGUVB14]|uniref:hypothetical protein n=1 Tax=Bradyrhizobium sp. CCGUVB14 TaxID=2949628 RepID=UPI0020B2C136|nr:hypothetical protein [Bradyrhizobium sp. CCGUVB14]MCP3447353.1 hypothetical protein [Bradyrhizobium sp. CCGUVB14]
MNNAPLSPVDFETLLAETDRVNANRVLARETAALPGTMDEALPFFRGLIERHHTAMLRADTASAMAIRSEAEQLATKLNNFEPGYLADSNAPGCVLDRKTRARKGKVPLWGQSGAFEIVVQGMRAWIDMDGVFGISASCVAWLDFKVRAIEWDKPFISETGYRSFLGLGGELVPDLTPDAFVREVIAQHIKVALKGKLLAIKPEYRDRIRSRQKSADSS